MVSRVELELLGVEANHYVEDNYKKTKCGVMWTSMATKFARPWNIGEHMNLCRWHPKTNPSQEVATCPRI